MQVMAAVAPPSQALPPLRKVKGRPRLIALVKGFLCLYKIPFHIYSKNVVVVSSAVCLNLDLFNLLDHSVNHDCEWDMQRVKNACW